MTNKKLGRILIAVGALLLAAAVSLVIYNKYRSSEAKKNAEETVIKLRAYAEKAAESSSLPDKDTESRPDPLPGSSTDTPPAPEEEEELTPLDIDGTRYIGIITVPKLGIELPVTEGWDYVKMQNAACVYSGSIKDRDIIICAHNYSSFFLDLEDLEEGDEVRFTGLDGREYIYRVDWEELISGLDAGTLRSGSDRWDLTLFTCTWSGYSRVTVRCTEVRGQQAAE